MNRWAVLVALAGLAIIGCGGTGPHQGGGGGGGGGGGPLRSSVNTGLLDKPGRLEVTINTGQGRIPGSLVAAIRHFEVEDEFGIVETFLNPEGRLGLDAYTSHMIQVNPTMDGFNPKLAARLFDQLPIEIQRIGEEQNGGGFIWYEGPNGQPIFRDSFDMRARVFPGRYTNVEIFLDDATLNLDFNASPVAALFDRQRFELINYDQSDLRINGWIGDYLEFDITNVANKPIFDPVGPYSGNTVTHVYISGDNYGVSADPMVGGAPMEILTTGVTPFEALVSPPNQVLGTPGTFTIKQVDPRDLNGIAKITALQGIWRMWHDSVNPSKGFILDPEAFEVFTLPSSDDNEFQEIIMLARNLNGDITDMYFGQIDYGTMTFAAWPIENVDDGSSVNEIDGVVSGLTYRSVPSPTYKDIRSGTVTITTWVGLPPPVTFQTSKEFLVVRL